MVKFSPELSRRFSPKLGQFELTCRNGTKFKSHGLVLIGLLRTEPSLNYKIGVAYPTKRCILTVFMSMYYGPVKNWDYEESRYTVVKFCSAREA